MNKKIILTLMVVMAFCLTACSQTSNKKMKTLVAYFSATGTTRQAAERLAKATGATLYEIEPQQPYTAADLDWNDDNSRANVETRNKKTRLGIKALSVNIADYDVIYVGFPIWWYTCPTLINTFMESADFKGKTVVPFATSGGSSIKRAENDLKAAYPDVKWKAGLLMNNVSDKELDRWIRQ